MKKPPPPAAGRNTRPLKAAFIIPSAAPYEAADVVGDESEDCGENCIHNHAEEEPSPAARLRLDDNKGDEAGGVEEDEDHKGEGNGRGEVRILLQALASPALSS